MPHLFLTGGSRGIGAATVRRFAREGWRVSFCYEKNEAAARVLSAQTGADGFRCDAADPEAVLALISSLPPVDVLINNAGISHVGLISQITPAQWDRLFAVNVRGIYNTVRAVLPGMLAAGSGCILNVSSMWGQVGASCEAAYSATKGAVDALTKALAKELGPSGIRVNALAPGVIQTDMLNSLSPEDIEALRLETPLEKLGRPEDVAAAMWFLASPAASFITGEVLNISGGFVI